MKIGFPLSLSLLVPWKSKLSVSIVPTLSLSRELSKLLFANHFRPWNCLLAISHDIHHEIYFNDILIWKLLENLFYRLCQPPHPFLPSTSVIAMKTLFDLKAVKLSALRARCVNISRCLPSTWIISSRSSKHWG